jgi:hypothetical protein
MKEHYKCFSLSGVVREFAAQPAIDRYLAGIHTKRSKRLLGSFRSQFNGQIIRYNPDDINTIIR